MQSCECMFSYSCNSSTQHLHAKAHVHSLSGHSLTHSPTLPTSSGRTVRSSDTRAQALLHMHSPPVTWPTYLSQARSSLQHMHLIVHTAHCMITTGCNLPTPGCQPRSHTPPPSLWRILPATTLVVRRYAHPIRHHHHRNPGYQSQPTTQSYTTAIALMYHHRRRRHRIVNHSVLSLTTKTSQSRTPTHHPHHHRMSITYHLHNHSRTSPNSSPPPPPHCHSLCLITTTTSQSRTPLNSSLSPSTTTTTANRTDWAQQPSACVLLVEGAR
jgi:hypothetical protein